MTIQEMREMRQLLDNTIDFIEGRGNLMIDACPTEFDLILGGKYCVKIKEPRTLRQLLRIMETEGGRFNTHPIAYLKEKLPATILDSVIEDC